MRVQVRNDRGGYVVEDVQHIHERSNGDVVLRFSGHKETIDGDDHNGFEVSPS